MPTSLKLLKFSKRDKFENLIFTASKSSDPENYEILKKIAEKLESSKYGTFLPVYHSVEHSYCSIRFQKDTKAKIAEGYYYDLGFTVNTVEKGGKTFVNCYIRNLKFVAQHKDMGTEIEF